MNLNKLLAIVAAVSYTLGGVCFLVVAIINTCDHQLNIGRMPRLENDILGLCGCVLYLLGSILFLTIAIRNIKE